MTGHRSFLLFCQISCEPKVPDISGKVGYLRNAPPGAMTRGSIRRTQPLSRHSVVLATLAITCLAASTARADEPKVEASKQDFVPDTAASDKKHEGWVPKIDLGAAISFGDNRGVVGQVDGATINLGFKFATFLAYYKGKHEWRNSFGLGAGITKTPALDEFVKSRDLLALESVYLYHYLPWFGPFARVSLDTPMFRGADVRPEAVPYSIARLDGSTDTVVARRLPLSDPFKPMTLKESVGPFARPYESDPFSFEARLGLGARETFAANQLAVDDNKDTPEIEVKELDDVYQLGGELVAAIWGELGSSRVSYRLGLDMMTPFAYSALAPGDDRGALELTNVELSALLTVKIVEWASFNYEFKALRQPQLLDRFQLQNNMLFTVGLVFDPKGLDAEKKK